MRILRNNSLDSWPILLLVPVFTCLMLIIGSFLLSRRAENPSVIAGLRGGTVAILRLPPQKEDMQQIWIDKDEIATRGNLYSGPRRKVQLTHTEWQAVNDLREAWCVSSPQFPVSRKDEAYYQIGLLCGTRFEVSYKQIEIPEDQLPTPLATLLSSVPKP